MRMPIPSESYLAKPYTLLHDQTKARIDFFQFARSRIRYVAPKEFNNLVTYTCESIDSSATYGCGYAVYERSDTHWFTQSESGMERHVKALSIWIVPEHFKPPFESEDFSDLIPITIEHELWELWINLRHDSLVPDVKRRHLFARCNEYEYALRIGKADRLLLFMLRDCSPSFREQYEYARRRAEKRQALWSS